MTTKQWTVILERARREPLTFGPEGGHRAFDRVHALCELHGCQFTQDNARGILTVHAGRYYQRPDERINPDAGPCTPVLTIGVKGGA
jgi:hypothetical protein